MDSRLAVRMDGAAVAAGSAGKGVLVQELFKAAKQAT